MTSLVDHALAHARRGFWVFPAVLAPDENGKLIKKPAIDSWQDAATRDKGTIRNWFGPNGPYANAIGISTSHFGEDQALLVVDEDVKGGKQGAATMAALEAEGYVLPRTLEVRTISGGRHLFFTTADPIKQGTDVLGPGVDTRSRGGFVVAAGSSFDGQSYTIKVDAPIASAPAWLIKHCGAAPIVEKSTAPAIEAPSAPQRALELVEKTDGAVEGNAGDTHTYKLACQLKDMGLSQADTLDMLLGRWNPKCQPPWSGEELARKVANAYAYGVQPQGAASPEAQFRPRPKSADAPPTLSRRPTICVSNHKLHELASIGEQALIAAGASIYQRGPSLVKPVLDDVAAAHGRKTKAARLKELTAPALIDSLSKAADWERHDVRKKGNVKVDPPFAVASTILARDGDWKFPVLAGVTTTQTMRPDGSLVVKEGYDPATRLLLLNPPEMPPIPEHPSREDALAALGLLIDLLAEFTFVDAASMAVALSALMTPVLRGAMRAVLMHIATAPTAGSSKSYLMDLMAAINTGQRCPVISAGASEEECEKRLASALIAGAPLISLDNLNDILRGDALCQYIERPVVEIRPLGRSELIRIQNTATIVGTGNNLTVSGDMVRRALIARLDTDLERPELRQFKADPVATVMADRGKYVAAILTIARAYISAGYPDLLPAVASFEDWSRLVRSPLVWLGQADPASTMEGARRDDPELIQMAQVVAAWAGVAGTSKEQTAGQIANTSVVGSELRDALLTIAESRKHGGQVDALLLGRWLARHKGRVVSGLKISGRRDTHSKQVVWWLESLAGVRVPAGTVSAGAPQSVSHESPFGDNDMTTAPRAIETIPANARNTRKTSVVEMVDPFS